MLKYQPLLSCDAWLLKKQGKLTTQRLLLWKSNIITFLLISIEATCLYPFP